MSCAVKCERLWSWINNVALVNSHMREVENLKKKAEEANIAKNHFLANISHEIRTPLAAVLGFFRGFVSRKN